MDIFFADDARQNNPSRRGMGPLVAAGGICVPGDAVRSLERDLTGLCTDFGFPAEEEFKWSPRRGSWMHGELVGERRQEFLIAALQLAAERNPSVVVVIEDTNCQPALHSRYRRHEDDATALMLERIEKVHRGRVVAADLYAVTPRGSLPKTFAQSLLSFSIWPFYGTLGVMIWLAMRIVIP